MILVVETRKMYGTQQEVHIGLTSQTKERLSKAAWIGSWVAVAALAVTAIKLQDKKNTETSDE